MSSRVTAERRAAFEARLAREGFGDLEVKSIAPNVINTAHSHPYDVLALVLAGEATLDCGDGPRTYRPGDVVDVAAGVVHTEHYGPDGYTFLVGRRHRDP